MKDKVALPVPRRGLSHEEAAAYCGLSVGAFDLQVRAGLFPPSLPFAGRRKVWDLHAIDRALDAMSGLSMKQSEEQRKKEALERILRDADQPRSRRSPL